MVVYAQSVSRICDLRMDQLGRNKDGLRTIRFYRIDVEIDKFIEPVIDRWLEERKSLTVMESAHDNKYLFPGRRPGDHISTSSVKYYYSQWGVTADQLLASSLFQMYCNGIRHPNVPHDAFGVSKAMTGKYIGIFDAHYHDAISYFQDKEKRCLMPESDEQWWLYLLECAGGLTYIGTAADVQTRFNKHKKGQGARFTKINKPLSIIAAQPFPDRSSACKAEYALKRKALFKKLEWAESWPWSDP